VNDPLLHELRERFRETSRARLEEMAPLLDAIDAESIHRLARHFHAFAGLGATYGFPRVSELGDEGEASILPLLRCAEEPDGATIARWRELCVEIERALGSGEPMHAVRGAAAERRRILAVEDDATHAVLLTHVLGTAGYDVAVCSDPEQFDETLVGFAPDLLLTDIHLAEDDRGGYDLVRRVRGDDRFRDLPVIFVSADHELESADGDPGVDPFVAKPVDWTRLLSLIESRLT
jgi:CheY-like chemotaxis protein